MESSLALSNDLPRTSHKPAHSDLNWPTQKKSGSISLSGLLLSGSDHVSFWLDAVESSSSDQIKLGSISPVFSA